MWLWWLDRKRDGSSVRCINSSPTERSPRSTAPNRLQLFICSPGQITATPLLVNSVFLLPRRIHTRLPSMTSQYHRFFLILHILRFLEIYKFQLNFSFFTSFFIILPHHVDPDYSTAIWPWALPRTDLARKQYSNWTACDGSSVVQALVGIMSYSLLHHVYHHTEEEKRQDRTHQSPLRQLAITRMPVES